jgi:hypothetical protein
MSDGIGVRAAMIGDVVAGALTNIKINRSLVSLKRYFYLPTFLQLSFEHIQ